MPERRAVGHTHIPPISAVSPASGRKLSATPMKVLPSTATNVAMLVPAAPRSVRSYQNVLGSALSFCR